MSVPRQDNRIEAKDGEPFNWKQILYHNDLSRAILEDQRMSLPARGVLVYLLSYFNVDTGIAWPEIRTLAQGVGVSERTMLRYIDEHIKYGYVARHSGRARPRKNNGGFQTSQYWMLWQPAYGKLARREEPDSRVTPVSDGQVTAVSGRRVTPVSDKLFNSELVDRSKASKDGDRSSKGVDLEPSYTSSDTPPSHQARTDECFPPRPNDEESIPFEGPGEPEQQREETTKPITWERTPEQAARLLAFMKKKTGSGDFGYAADTWSLVERGAESPDAVFEVLTKKVRGRPRNNGYIRAVIVDHFGELPEQRAVREAAQRESLERRRTAEGEFDQLRKEALAKGDTAAWEELTKLGKQRWLIEQYRQGRAA